MKINSILNRYIFAETLPPFGICLLFLSFVFMMTSLLEITNLVVNYRVGLITVALLMVYSLPFFLSYIIPMSVMMAVLLTFLRLSGDHEVTAMKTAGISLYNLLPPVLLFSFLGSVATGFMAIHGIPWGKRLFKEQIFAVARSNLEIGLKERTFSDIFPDVMIYVNEIDMKKKTLIDVFIEDQREKGVVSTTVSPRGELFYDSLNLSSTLRLYNGIINQVSLKNKTSHSIRFDTYDITLDLNNGGGMSKERRRHREEMSLREMRDYIKKSGEKNSLYYRILMDYHKKFSIPAACMALGILAVPLGTQTRGAGRSYGIGLGIIFFLFYYLLLTAGWAFGESGAYPPAVGMWLPDAVMTVIGLFLLIRAANDRTFHFQRVVAFVDRMKTRIQAVK